MVAGVNGLRLALAPASPLQASGGAELPTRIKLLGWGRNETSEGVVIVDELTAKVFSANQKAIGRERVQVDFEHNTVPGTPEYQRTTEPRAVAGHAALVCVPGEGIFGEAITYTATGKKAAPDFEDVSLAPYLDGQRRVIGAHSFALTHTGATYGLNFAQAPEKLSAAENQIGAELQILSATTKPTTQNNMSEATLESLSAQIAGLAKNLETRIAALEQSKPVDLAPLSARLEVFEKKLTDSEKAIADGKRGQLVTLFASQGKVPKKADGSAYTAAELQAANLETLELLLANTPVTVPLSARNGAHATESAKSYKDSQGNVDLSAIFNDEAQRTGLTATPPTV